MSELEKAVIEALINYGDKTIDELSKLIGFNNHKALQAILERLQENERVLLKEVGIFPDSKYVWSYNHDYYN